MLAYVLAAVMSISSFDATTQPHRRTEHERRRPVRPLPGVPAAGFR